ncbi:MAG: thiamine-phosphate kinase [Chloroflexi bacterium]|nr:thiamine-phosphate kinase [Chloroflexota bacterium]
MVPITPSIMRCMDVGDIGEFELIDRLAATIAAEGKASIAAIEGHGFRLRLAVGDDAAAWDARSGVQVLTTDTMVEGVHFDLAYTGWRDLGWKAVAVNLSDVAAMGCTPLYSIVTLGLRDDLPVEGLVEMYRGMLDVSGRIGGGIVGGDVVRSPVFFVTLAMQGVAADTDDPTLLTRHSASAGDAVAVTGHLGCSAGGLRAMSDPTLRIAGETKAHLEAAHNRPVPRVPEGLGLVAHGITTAMDVSDGLVDDLGKICAASGVGAVIHSDRLPADRYLREAFPDDWLELALGGGEDYELLFTGSPELVRRCAGSLKVPVSIIGQIVQGSAVKVLDGRGQELEVRSRGWDHLARSR